MAKRPPPHRVDHSPHTPGGLLTFPVHRKAYLGKLGRWQDSCSCDNVSFMATPACSICQRSDLTAIEAALSAGGTLIPTSAQYGVSKSALGRHRANCLAPKLKAAAKVLEPVRETRAPVERAKAIVMGEMPSPHDVLTLTGLLDRIGRSLDRLEGAAEAAATDNLHSALAAVSGQFHRGVEAAARLQGLYAEPEMQQQNKFSINIVIPQAG